MSWTAARKHACANLPKRLTSGTPLGDPTRQPRYHECARRSIGRPEVLRPRLLAGLPLLRIETIAT
jgi:hypothetical protein